MLIQYTLSMPNNNAWNGRWSGEGNLYAVVRSYRAKSIYEPIIEKGYWHYSFGDGWAAGISAKEVTAAQSRSTRKKSQGFCGYDWMIDSIERRGVISPYAA